MTAAEKERRAELKKKVLAGKKLNAGELKELYLLNSQAHSDRLDYALKNTAPPLPKQIP